MEHTFICCTYWPSKTVQNQKECLLFEDPTVRGWRCGLGKVHFGAFLFLGKHFVTQCRGDFNRKLRIFNMFYIHLLVNRWVLGGGFFFNDYIFVKGISFYFF